MRVQCYRNLVRGGWSLRANGRVLGHTDSAVLEHVTFRVQPAAQRKIAAGAHRSVHAWCEGELCDCESRADQIALIWGEHIAVTYRPHERGEFFRRDTGEPIAAARYALFTKDKGMFVIL